MDQDRPNPFVGPRPLAYGEHLYGREREIAQIRDLLISEQVLVLYSPSGAGKTSLIQAGLRPALEDEGLTVLRAARVARLPSPISEATVGSNRYVQSILTDLEEMFSSPLPVEDLCRLSLAEYLARRMDQDTGDCVLVLDQFEEFFTADPIDSRAKQACVAQLSRALGNTNLKLWLLLAMREEYIGSLDPFSESIPGYLSTRFRLELLGTEAARLAIRGASADGGIPFAEQRIASLIDDLRAVRIRQPDGTFVEKLGEYVEPVHLQVVCRRLWRDLSEQATGNSEPRPHARGDVDDALTAYYDECVAAATRQGTVGERALRDWLSRELITAQGMRGQALRGSESCKGVDQRALDRLVDDHLIRAEVRRGLAWYELAHDRLLEPVQESTRRWRETHLKPWQRMADLWASAGRPSSSLLTGAALEEARTWSARHSDTTSAVDRDFLEAAKRAQFAEQAETRRKRAVWTLAGIVALTLLALGGYRHWTWIQHRPWGLLVNLSDGQVHPLEEDYILVGRAADGLTPSISLNPPVVSAAHLLIDRKGRGMDLRTLWGTSRNGGFLHSEELADQDVLVLANVAPFKFHSVHYSWWQLWGAPKPLRATIPQGSWGLLSDGASRLVHYLVAESYYVGVAADDKLVVAQARGAESRLIVSRHRRPESASDRLVIEDLADEHDLIATFKLGPQVVVACVIPPGRAFEDVSFETLDKSHACRRLVWHPGDQEAIQYHQPIQNLIFYPSNQSSFRVIPIIRDLEGASG